MQELGAYWTANPDLRLGQIVGNFSPRVDPYFLEDNVLLERLKEANENR
jgi:hypothetical protein